MITVKFFGGSKKSFSTDQLSIEKDNFTIQELLDYLVSNKPEDTPNLDINNILVAINGVDSSAIEGKLTRLHPNDEISIIPVIHGGSRRIQFKIGGSSVELLQIVNNKKIDINFLDNIRKKFPQLILQGISINHILNISYAKKIISLSLMAKKNCLLLSKTLETDILLRFALTTQISRAIKKVGITPKKNFTLIAIGPKSILEKLFFELKPFLNFDPISTHNESFFKKEYQISKKQLGSIQSKTPLEDILVEKAVVLFG